ncbi:MAG: hypothetical protein SO369_06740 [Treponema sp.]|nr:hypothetical protein [Treponema sp.]
MDYRSHRGGCHSWSSRSPLVVVPVNRHFRQSSGVPCSPAYHVCLRGGKDNRYVVQAHHTQEQGGDLRAILHA